MRLACLRRHLVSKACALWFIVLILLPFTAPFPTYHLQGSSSGRPYDALPKDLREKAGSEDKLALPTEWSMLPDALDTVVTTHSPAAYRPAELPPRHIVLRL